MPQLRTGAMSLVEAVEYIRNDEAYVAALAEIQEVREVLERYWKLIQVEPPLVQSSDYERARKLIERLRIEDHSNVPEG